MSFIGELFEMIVEGAQELTELTSVGLYEMVIKDNPNYQTSFEKKERANQIMATVRSKYNSTFEEVKEYYEETDKQIKIHYNYKRSINETLISNDVELLKTVEIKLTDINLKKNSSLDVASLLSMGAITLATKNALGNTIAATFCKINPALFGIYTVSGIISQARRIGEANEYLDDVKMRREEINYEIEQLETLKSRLSYIREVIKDERYILQILIDELEIYTLSIKGLLTKNLENNSLKKIEYYFSIASLIKDTITTTFIDEKGIISDEYSDLLYKLNEMHKQLQEVM
jgi:hypothetical protein